jgi:DNA-binding response OmpR family regulator
MENIARILIADDDESCLLTTAAFLTNAGYECDCAATGDAALALSKQNKYDLFISDIEMPGNRDLCMIQAMAQSQPGLPIFLMTGYPTIETAANSVNLSVAAYLLKPLNPDVLLEKVARAVEYARCYRKVAGTRERMIATCEDLKRIEASFRISDGSSSNAAMQAFIDLTMQNLTASLLDLRQLFETVTQTSPRSQDQEWLQSARPLVLINALRETIAVLAKTKSSFKSKELAELRRKLEGLFQEPS